MKRQIKSAPGSWLKMLVLTLCPALCGSCAGQADYKIADGPLLTRWAKQVSPKKPLPEYPRPQMVRKQWLNLNGLWDYAIRPKDDPQPSVFDGQILVPYPVESALSGVMKTVGKDNRLWYRRDVEIPRKWKNQRLLLHFGAVDWDATVWVNDKKVGTHRGGYDPFSFDITDALKSTGPQQIVVSVWDPTNAGTQPRGKQVTQPRGIWYTAVTGIWRTVWLEPVPETCIRSLLIVPDVDNQQAVITVDIAGDPAGIEFRASVSARDLSSEAKSIGRNQLTLHMPGAKLWSPDSPHLYDATVSIARAGKEIDRVRTYFGMRKIEVKKDQAGINRLFLNNQPLFQFGPLDQGWWPDGLYTAPTDAALRYDIEVLKKLGCNMLRKHVKVEPDRLYYWCDKLGLMVWQDMPNGDRHIRGSQPDLERAEESARQFELEWTNVIKSLRNHPCIVMWVPFNEGWGQYDTERIVEMTKKLDPTRLVNNASGWSDRGVGDVHDIHRYPGPAAPPVEEHRAAVLGEFGGLGLPIKGHTWQAEKNWGYRTYKSRQELTDAYVNLLERLRPLISAGLAAAVYTQTSDVEIEVNGLMTYDRAIIKPDLERAAEAARRLYLPPPIIKPVVPTSQQQGFQWSYTTETPPAGWEKPAFDDSTWKKGPAGFGTKDTPGTVVRTQWNTPDIWIRRTFQLARIPEQPHLSIHHDEDAQVYINGTLVAELKGYTTSYVQVGLDEKARGALKTGTNCIAIHCKQSTGGQYIDAGILDIREQPQ